MASGSEDTALVGIYSSTTGLLEKVRYHAGMSYDDAEYFYDELARLEKIEDWLGGNGLRYAYDAAGRMTTLTDYDDPTLEYEYDAAGNVESMTDYHNNETTCVYDDAGRFTPMTTPYFPSCPRRRESSGKPKWIPACAGRTEGMVSFGTDASVHGLGSPQLKQCHRYRSPPHSLRKQPVAGDRRPSRTQEWGIKGW